MARVHSAYLVVALAEIGAEWSVNIPLIYLIKPLLMLLLLQFWLYPQGADHGRAAPLMGLAIGFGLVGDILLMIHTEGLFVYGLAAFLAGHLAYLTIFLRTAPLRWRDTPLLAPALVAGGAMLILIWPGLPEGLRLPVVLYATALCTMFWRAICLYRRYVQENCSGRKAGWIRYSGALGGALFVFSDALIAWTRFVQPVAGQRVLIMATYLAAQWLLTMAVLGTCRTGSGQLQAD